MICMAYIHTEQTHTYIYKEKRFSSVYYEWGYIIVQMTSQTCVQKFNLNIQSICTCTTSQSETHDSQDAEWRNVPWCINNYVYRTDKEKKSHHMKSSFAAQVSLWKKKKFSQHALMKNVLASTFDWKRDFSRFHSLTRSLNGIRLSQLVRAWFLFF